MSLHCCFDFYPIAVEYAECHRSAPAHESLVLFACCDKRNLIVAAEISAVPYIPKPDVAGGVYTKEAEEAHRVADDLVVEQAGDRAEGDYDRAAAVNSSGTDIICTHSIQ
ncbi:hypothetical protein KIN20_002540 [Parelaphostrongylus tenuis]|uniref:Uncharacterized protein n=1 Tax=Parelaphostrongylus tenuis TaxID=148309 RepID=A0AAD5LVD6_PARTN|nr:hypothetical protein KIN20_002540 [Parelaphostrongylus tenuis]